MTSSEQGKEKRINIIHILTGFEGNMRFVRPENRTFGCDHKAEGYSLVIRVCKMHIAGHIGR